MADDEVDDPIAAWNDALMMGSLQQMAGLSAGQAVEMGRDDIERLAFRRVMDETVQAVVTLHEGEEWKGVTAIDVLAEMIGELAFLAARHDPRATGLALRRPFADLLGSDRTPFEL